MNSKQRPRERTVPVLLVAIIFSFLLVLGQNVVLVDAGAVKNNMNEEQMFAHVWSQAVCYRRRPVVSYVTKTRAWKDGRRNVLDWGCGSGALSAVLAERGADKVVAMDLYRTAVRCAKQRLSAQPNAMARLPRGNDGRIAYRNQFDLVVSYMGALSDCTSSDQTMKIPASKAMDLAVRACRGNGSVIIAKCFQLGPLIRLPVFVALVIAYHTRKPQNEEENLKGWQMAFLSASTTLVGGDPLLPFAADIAAQSCRTGKKKMKWLRRTVAIAWSLSYVLEFVTHSRTEWEQETNAREMMKRAGLVKIKASRRPCHRVLEALETNDFSKSVARRFNRLFYPGGVVIYEGKKPCKRN